MTTRTEHAAAQEKVATVKRRSRQPVEVRHVAPVRPDRSQFPAGVGGTHEYREAETAYESALLAFAVESGLPAEVAGDLAAIEEHFNILAPNVPAVSANGSADQKPRRAKKATAPDPADDFGGPSSDTRRSEGKAPAPKLAPEEVERRKARAIEHADHEAKKATTSRAKKDTREEYDRLTAIPLSKRTAAQNRRIRTLGNRPENTTEGRKAPAKSAPKSTAKATTAKKAAGRTPALDAPEGFKSWTDPKLATAIVRMKTTKGYTIKAIAHELGLPAEHRSWFAVSKVWRETADAKGIDRPRLSEEAIAARKEKNGSK
jgi:hypothetical protein